MARIVIYDPESEDSPVVSILGRLRNPQGALREMGALLVKESGRAFEEQRLGSVAWPERYEGGPEPYVNVAGLVADFNQGSRRPKARRFDRRPALRDQGDLERSVSFEVIGRDTVEAGSALPYARTHQEGGESRQSVTKQTKAALWKWLKRQDKTMKRRLGWLLNKTITELETNVHRRPFVGVTEDLAPELVEVVERHLVGED